MDQNKIENILLKIIKVGIFISLLTPLILGPFGLNFSEYPKAVFFRSIIEIVFLFYISLILINKKYLPKISLLCFSLLIFYIIMFIASIFGINFHLSFFGDMIRGEGLIMHLHLIIFFIIITSVFLQKEDWFNLLKFSVLISGISSIIAILQQAKIARFFNMYEDGTRLSGSLSNPDLFGWYISLSIFIIIFLLISEKNKNHKIILLFLLLLNLYTLFWSGTRSSWFGLFAGIISIMILNFFKLNYKKILGIIVLLLIIIFSILFVGLNSHWIKDIPRGAVIIRIADTNLGDRVITWKAGINATKDKPILGWGFESFGYISDKYYLVDLSNNIYFDRPHNKIIEILVYSGIIGFLCYLFIFLAIFYLVFKYAKLYQKEEIEPIISYNSVLVGFFICYFTQNIFAFDNIATYILFFIFVGFINNFFGKKIETEESENLLLKINKNILYFKAIIIILIFFTIIQIFYHVNLKPTIAVTYFPSSIIYEKADPKRAFNGYKQGININTIYNNDIRLAFIDRALYILENNKAKGSESEIIKSLLEIKPFLYKLVDNSNYNKINHTYQFIARINKQEYIFYKNNNALIEMEKILSKAILFNPNMAFNYQLMGELKIFQNNYSKGEEYIKKSCILDGSNDIIFYKKIGNAYLKKEDFLLSLKNFEKVIDINLENKKQGLLLFGISPDFIDYVAYLYYNKEKNQEKALIIYKKGIELYPEYKDIFKKRFESIILENK